MKEYFKILKRCFITIYKFYETVFRKTEFGKFSRNNLIGKSMRSSFAKQLSGDLHEIFYVKQIN